MRRCRKLLIIPAVLVGTAALLWPQTQRPAQAVFDEARALGAKSDAASLRLALERYTQAQALFRTEDKPAMEAEALASQAEVYDRLGDRVSALRDYQATAELYRKLGNHAEEALSIALGANEQRELKRFDEAIRDYERALAVARAAHDRKSEADMLYWLGTGWQYRGDNEKARVEYQRAIAIYRELHESHSEAQTLYILGTAQDRLSRFEEAAESYLNAIAIFRKEKAPDLAFALNNLGADYRYLSRYKEAIDCFNQAAPLYHQIGDPSGEATLLINLGSAYAALSDFDKAIDCWTRADAVFRNVGDDFARAVALNNLGSAYDSLHNEPKAIEYYEQALALVRKVKDRTGEGRTLVNIGKAYVGMGELQRGISFYEQALAIINQGHDRHAQGIVLSNLGAAYSRVGNYASATGYLDRAVIVLRETKDRNGEAKAFSNLMDACATHGYTRLGIMYGKEAVNLYQSIRVGITGLSEDLQRSYAEGNEPIYRKLADLLIDQGRLAEAQRTLDLLKQEEFYAFVRRDAQTAGPSGQIALSPQEALWAKNSEQYLVAIAQQRGELFAKEQRSPEEEAQLARLDQELMPGNTRFQEFLDKLASDSASHSDTVEKVRVIREAEGLMATLRQLKHGAVAIYTLVGEDKYRAILVTPDVEKAYEYPIRAADLNRKVQQFRQAVQSPKIDPRPLAQELYGILIGANLAEDLRQAKAETLMWSLDGALRYVPLAALYDGKQYLVEQFRLEVFTPESKDRLKDAPAKQWTAAAFGVTKAHGDFAALPQVAGELRGIIQDAGQKGGGMRGEVMLDDQFTQTAMQAALRKRFSVIHIASHFSFEPGNDTNSFLLLGDGAHLTLAGLKTFPPSNSFDLLTLSACNTGLNEPNAQGNEVDGLGVLAQRKGAKAVLASLWEVSDESTSLLMQRFYKLREAHPDGTKSEALRAAQLEMLRGETQAANPGGAVARGVNRAWKPDAPGVGARPFERDEKAPFAHPYYWAPFFLIGNWL